MTAHDHKGHGISRQAVAAAELVRALQDDDEQLIHDTVEGETDFFEAVERALDEIADCEIVQAGCAEMGKKISDRATRAKKRAERLRGLIDQAFQMAEVKSHQFPTATITIKAIPPKLIVADEASIPSDFFEPQPPKLDKKALLNALKSGRRIEGAELSNGGRAIQIRRA